jgi:uncharacterized membrane protein
VESLSEFLRLAMEGAALGVEVLAVLVIVIATAFGTGRFLFHISQRRVDAYRSYKERLTKALLLGLEFLVAADIVRTVAIETTLTNVAILGALVVVRTILSWSLIVEMDGRWPWQVAGAHAVKDES